MRDIRFTFLCNLDERRLISSIAQQLNRSQGDAIRILLYRAADDLGIDDEHHEPLKSKTKGENDG